MLTLSFGFKKPQTNDKGPVVFPAMEANIQQVNDHDHDGANSKQLSAIAVAGQAVSVLAANWVAVGDGQYRQQVTLPAGFDFDKVYISFRLASGDYVYPTILKVSATQYWVYTNDNSLTYTAVYGG